MENPDLDCCSFCYMPGAKHEGGAEIDGKQVSGIFCNKTCFEKWLKWKSAVIPHFKESR
jgi:hypothetical protein